MSQMNVALALAVLLIFSLVLNVIHWRFRAGEKSFYLARSGSIRAIQTLLTLMLPVLAVLFLLHVISAILFLTITYFDLFAAAVYSVWIRHCKRKNSTGQK
jgi:hypothetical protein